jgi:hypothetical protein
LTLFAFAIAIYSFLSAIVLGANSKRVPHYGPPTGRCGKCRYDLGGLRAEALCPECGSAEREHERLSSELEVNPEVMSPWLLTLLGFAIALVLAWPIAWLFVIPAYLNEGFSLSQATTNPPNRELLDAGSIFWLMAPFIGAVSISPLAVVVRNAGRARVIILILWGLGFIGGFAVSLFCSAAQVGPP